MFRILLADDHQGVRAQVRCVLETADWGVCGEAENGQEAVEKVSSQTWSSSIWTCRE